MEGIEDKYLNKIYNKFLGYYKKEGVAIKKKELQEMMRNAEEKAKSNYKNLRGLKTCSLNVYTQIWVWDIVSYDLATKSVKTIKVNDPPVSLKASVAFHTLFPEEVLRNFKKKLSDTSIENRKEVWKGLGIPMIAIEKNLKEMVKERNTNAKSKGFTGQLSFALNWYKISKSDYKNFVRETEKLIEYCNKQLSDFTELPKRFYSEFNLPCYLCQLFSIQFKTQEEVIDYVSSKFKNIAEFKQKIVVKMGEKSKMNYKKEIDSFEITIDKNGNSRHKLMDLLHELAHVADYLQLFKNGLNPYEKGVYLREKEATEIEYKLLKELSPELYKAKFGDALLNFWESLFTIELYSNPDQNLGKPYASLFNKCFKEANQKYNPTYILNENIVLQPFYTLPHTIAYSEIIQMLISELIV